MLKVRTGFSNLVVTHRIWSIIIRYAVCESSASGSLALCGDVLSCPVS